MHKYAVTMSNWEGTSVEHVYADNATQAVKKMRREMEGNYIVDCRFRIG